LIIDNISIRNSLPNSKDYIQLKYYQLSIFNYQLKNYPLKKEPPEESGGIFLEIKHKQTYLKQNLVFPVRNAAALATTRHIQTIRMM